MSMKVDHLEAFRALDEELRLLKEDQGLLKEKKLGYLAADGFVVLGDWDWVTFLWQPMIGRSFGNKQKSTH